MKNTYYSKLDKIKEAKNVMQEFFDKYDYVEDAISDIINYAWAIRHQDYALFRAIMAVFHAATITEDLRWGWNFYMPTTDDACDWMCKYSRKYARQDERYRRERGI